MGLKKKISYDLDMHFFLKQGQVELCNSCFASDYAETVIISRLQVERLNMVIGIKGMENVDILGQLKASRKDMYMLEWQSQQHELMVDDLKFKIKELQLLRVTKELQAHLRYDELVQILFF